MATTTCSRDPGGVRVGSAGARMTPGPTSGTGATHQIIYLLKLLELAENSLPGRPRRRCLSATSSSP